MTDITEVGACVFISHSRKDIKIAQQLRDALRKTGFDTFWDRHHIALGEP